MNQSSINTNQIQFIISDKVRLTEFNPSKSYAKSVYIIYDNIVYLSKVDITPGEFNPEQWEKISITDELTKKQDKIQATGVDNLLTAPEEEGGQPGIIPINSFEPAFEILSKEKGGTGSDLTTILTQDNNGDILVIDEQGHISNVEKLERVSLSQEINDSLDLAKTSIQPDALDDAIDNVNTTITTHINNKNNPHAVTKAQVGLGNVDNTADIDKPISNATQEALDSLEANFDANIDSINAEITSINKGINELDERKADKTTTLAGYGITDAYTRDEVNTELDKKLDETVAAETYATIVNLNSHTSNTSNPHKVTKAQVGLGNVDNTSDANKPVSTAVRAALDLKADAESVYTKTETYDQATIDNKLAEKLDIDTASSTYATIDSLETHTSNTSNPHSVTKAQVGLGNVDNTSDLAKPISNATQAALDLKANISDVEADLDTKQDTLVSGTNIKTINNNTILGSGNIQLQTELSGTEGNVVIYTSTTGQLNELGFDETPTLDSNSLLTSSVVYNALLDKINYTDIVNDITTGGVNKVLSAEQGKYLNNRITQAMQSTHNRGVVLNALTSQGQNYSVTNATINNGGTGYRDGDALLLVSEELKIDSIIVVETIDSNGVITAISLSKGGSFVSDPAGTGVSYVGGSGSGATFDITSSLVDNITLEDITNPQPNDFATVIQDELHNNVIYVWQYADFNGDGTYNWVSGYPVQTDQRDFIVEPITVNELATNAVSTVKIVDGNVTLNKLASNSVNGTKIVANTINDSHIAADASIAQSKIANLITDLNSKANQATTYTKTEVDNKVNTKQNTITGAATSIVSDNLTADRVLVSNTDGKVTVSSISTTKVGYLTDVTSNIQAQINSKANQSTTYNKTEVNDLLDAKLDSDTAASTYATQATVTSHINNKNNPHTVTKTQVGLGNVDNTSDIDKPVSTAQTTAISDAVSTHNASETAHSNQFSQYRTSANQDTIDNQIKSDITNLQSTKADKATTLAGYGITDAYTKTQVDQKINDVQGDVDTLNTKVPSNASASNKMATAAEISNLQNQIDENALDIEALQGAGGALNAYNFNTATPTQETLTKYAVDQIWPGNTNWAWNAANPAASTFTSADGVSRTAAEIFNSTWVNNTYDDHRWQLTNTQNTTPKVFEWADVGRDIVSVATATTAGIVRVGSGSQMVVNPTTGDISLDGTKAESIRDTIGAVATNQGTANAGKVLTVGDDGNIELADGASGAGRNIGDIFWTTRTDSALNGAVEANGAQYNFADLNGGDNNVQSLLENGKLPYITINEFDAMVSEQGGCDSFGYDSGATYFKVPKKVGRVLVRSQKPTADNNYTWYNLYSDGWVEQGGTVNGGTSQTATFPVEMADTKYTIAYGNRSGTYEQVRTATRKTTSITIKNANDAGTVSTDWQVSGYANSSEYTPDKWDYQNVQVERPMVQLFNSATDEAVAQCTEVLADVAGLKQTTDGMIDYVVESQEPTSANGYTWYRLYKSGWVEQGGYREGVSNTIITLPIPMADINYTLIKTINDDYKGNTNHCDWASSSAAKISTTQIRLNAHGGGAIQSWQVSGMSAQ